MNNRNPLLLGIALAAVSGIASADDGNLLPNGDFSDANQAAGWTNLGGGTMAFSSKQDANGVGTSAHCS